MLSCRFDNLSVSLMVVVSSVTLAYNLYIGLTKSDLYNHIWVDRSDKSHPFCKFKYIKKSIINHQKDFLFVANFLCLHGYKSPWFYYYYVPKVLVYSADLFRFLVDVLRSYVLANARLLVL